MIYSKYPSIIAHISLCLSLSINFLWCYLSSQLSFLAIFIRSLRLSPTSLASKDNSVHICLCSHVLFPSSTNRKFLSYTLSLSLSLAIRFLFFCVYENHIFSLSLYSYFQPHFQSSLCKINVWMSDRAWAWHEGCVGVCPEACPIIVWVCVSPSLMNLS